MKVSVYRGSGHTTLLKFSFLHSVFMSEKDKCASTTKKQTNKQRKNPGNNVAPFPHIRSFSLQQTRPSQTTTLVRHRDQLTSVPYGSQSHEHIYSTASAPETQGQLRKGGKRDWRVQFILKSAGTRP